jgi:putative copper export protein
MAVLTAVLQAAGGVIFMRVFGNDLGGASTSVHRLVRVAATTGIVLVLARQGIEAARFAGDFAGIGDVQLQRLAWGSRDGWAHVAQMIALASIIRSPVAPAPTVSRIAVLGAVAAAVVFATTGHASAHNARELLMPVLALHTLAAAFWFGSLAPLLIVVRKLPATTAARVLTRFSRIARWSVAALVIAAVTLAVALSPGLQVLKQPYGVMLIVKSAALVALLALALFNYRRGLPLLQRQPPATTTLQFSIAAEVGLMVVVLAATAMLTTLFSPEG